MDKEKIIKTITERLLEKEASPLSTALMYRRNKQNLKNSGNSIDDKFYHARANFQAGQMYDISTALFLNYGREIWDLLRKNTWDKVQGRTFKDTLKDSKRDIEADNYGLMQGILHPFSNANDILDRSLLRNLNR